MDRELTTTVEVMDALGGIPETAKLTGAEYGTAWMWKPAGTFPPRYYLVMIEELKRRGFHAPASLWGMVEPDRVAS